jgi:phosphate-selective porin OprO and OprP
VAVVAGLLGVSGGGMTFAADEQQQPTTQELIEQIQALKAQVERLQTAQERQADALTAREVDATVAGVLADADRRSRLLQAQGFTAGYDKGKFIIQSEDGNFLLHPYIQFLFRHATTFREDGEPDDGNDVQNGFEVRRLKIGFDGNLYTKDLTYHFLWATDRKSGNLVLEEAYGNFKFPGKYNDFAVRGGQFKNYFSHEAMSSSRRLFASERSLLNDVFTGGDNFVQGVALLYDTGDHVRAAISYTDGANAPNQNFQDFPTNKANFGFAGRLEYKAFGDWKGYDDFTALDNKADLLVLGGGFDNTQAGDTNTFAHTVDAHYERGRLGAFAAYLGRTIDSNDANLYDWGFLVQAGYLVTKQFEPYIRYDMIRFDPAGIAEPLENDVHEITVGFNYYFKGHSAKLTTDFSWLPNGSPVTNDGSDVLITPAGDGEYILRAQFQILL